MNGNNNHDDPKEPLPPPPPPQPPSSQIGSSPSRGHNGANNSVSSGLPPRHDRKVSWGGVSPTPSMLLSTPPPPQVSTATQNVTTNTCTTSRNWNGTFLDSLQKQSQNMISTRRFNLNDVLGSGPVELEAETHILRAVEKIAGQRHQRTATDMQTLFSEIAADEISRSIQKDNESDLDDDNDDDDDQFDLDRPAEQVQVQTIIESNSNANNTDRAPDVVAAMSSMDSMQSYNSPGNVIHTANEQSIEYPLEKTATGSGLSMDSASKQAKSTRSLGGAAVASMSKSTRSLGNNGAAKSKFKSAVRKQMMANSVEQTLFGLTSTLNTMKEEEKRKEHHRAATQMNLAEASKLAETANAVAGHLGASSSYDELGGTVAKENELHTTDSNTSDVEAPGQQSDTEVMGDTDDSSGDYCDDDRSTAPNHDKQQTPGKTSTRTREKRKKRTTRLISNNMKEDFQLLQEFLSHRKWQMQKYIYRVILFVMLPSIGVATLFYYFVENPTLCEQSVQKNNNSSSNNNGTHTNQVSLEVITSVCSHAGATVSWWILFLGVRQVITFTMALITQAFIVDYLALGSRFCLRFFGPLITLFLVQSKGWPFVTIFWAVYDLILLSGNRDYAQHWGYWQDWVGMFNQSNSSGTVVEHEMNYMMLKLAIIVGVVVAFKRLFVSLFLGRQTFAHYGEQLASVMKNMVLVGQIATLAKDIEYYAEQDIDNISVYHDGANKVSGEIVQNAIQQLLSNQADAEQEAKALRDSQIGSSAAAAAKTFMANRKTPVATTITTPGSFQGLAPSAGAASASNEDFTASEQRKLSELLDAWEEPQTAEQKEEKKITIGAVLQFRQALTFMQKRHPFLPAFGPADTRNRCIESAQRVFERLLMRTPGRDELSFETLALLSKDDDGRINQDKAKEMIRVFRPDREGTLTKLEFVKSIDIIYKSIRLLSANVRNSSQIDKAVENLVNTVFYIILGSFVLGQLGVNPLQLFFSLSSVILAFAFMFGNSSSKYFEGMLFILVQRPYGVGDRVHLSNPQLETNIDGSSGWVVEKVSLYTTSLYWGATNERATIANGSISNLRVINANRSPHAQLFVNMKFAIDTPYEKIVIFKAAVEQFLKDRPREWLSFVGFRPTEVAVERSFINYVTVAQHRSGWQDIGQILTSKAELVTYELEVAKQLEMSYSCPPLPVDLTMKGSASELTPEALKAQAGW